MIDFLICLLIIALFAGGFWCGKKFNSASAMVEAFFQSFKKV